MVPFYVAKKQDCVSGLVYGCFLFRCNAPPSMLVGYTRVSTDEQTMAQWPVCRESLPYLQFTSRMP